MDITHNKLCNATLGAPSDMPAPACQPLPVFQYTDEDGPWSASFWQPTPEELKLINAKQPIVLRVRAFGRQHPVVSLSVLVDE